jgi:hypothetical protein
MRVLESTHKTFPGVTVRVVVRSGESDKEACLRAWDRFRLESFFAMRSSFIGVEQMSNLPSWPGASHCYGKAYKLLERMAKNGHVIQSYRRNKRVCTVSEEMETLIAALNKGDEEQIKGILLYARSN